MLEILSHQYLKTFLKDQTINWEHIYSFGRLISKCIDNNSTYLVNSEIFSTNDWLPPILISLFLNEEDAIFILSEKKIQFINQSLIKSFKNLGFDCLLFHKLYGLDFGVLILKSRQLNLILLFRCS